MNFFPYTFPLNFLLTNGFQSRSKVDGWFTPNPPPIPIPNPNQDEILGMSWWGGDMRYMGSNKGEMAQR